VLVDGKINYDPAFKRAMLLFAGALALVVVMIIATMSAKAAETLPEFGLSSGVICNSAERASFVGQLQQSGTALAVAMTQVDERFGKNSCGYGAFAYVKRRELPPVITTRGELKMYVMIVVGVFNPVAFKWQRMEPVTQWSYAFVPGTRI
jgi:hypothetical protein